MKDFYLLSETARAAGIKNYQLAYLLATNTVPEPALWIGGKRVFSPAEVEHVRKVVAERAARKGKTR